MPPSASGDEPQERPAHQAPDAEAREEVHHVEPAVRDEDAQRDVHAVADRDHLELFVRARTATTIGVGAGDHRREPQKATRSAEEELDVRAACT